MMDALHHTIDTFGGLNEDENTAAVARDQLRKALNCARNGKLTGTRPGLAYESSGFSEGISGDPAIQGLHEFRSGRDANRNIIAVADGDVYYDYNSTLSQSGSPTISSGADYVWTFANYQNQVWAAGGQHGTDSIWSWDGNTGNAVTTRLASLGLNPKYVFQKFNCLFLGGFDGSDATNDSLRARYCDYATDATDTVNWPTANQIPGQLLGENPGVGSRGDEYHTGFGSYQDNKGDFLLFLTNRRIISFRQNPAVTSNANRFIQTDAIANGCVDQRAFVDLGYDQGDAVYVSTDGIHSMALSQQYGNRENTFLSWPIRKTWAGLNKSRLQYTTASYWPDEGLVLFAMSTGSSSAHDLILAMDIKGAPQITPDTVRWYKWQLNGLNANVLRAARTANGTPTIYVGTTAGDVCLFTRSVYSDLGAAINTDFRSKDEGYGAPYADKTVGDGFFMIGGNGSHQPTHQYIFDDGRTSGPTNSLELENSGGVYGTGTYGTATYGSSEDITRLRVNGYGSGYTVSHRFQHDGVSEAFFVGQIDQEVFGSGIASEASAE